MNLVITNHNPAPLPVMSSDEGGWCESAQTNVALTIDKAESDVIILGDKPSVSESIIEGLGTAFEAIKRVLTRPKPTPQSASQEILDATIGNNGPNAVRVIPGDTQSEVTLGPGSTFRAVAHDWIEVRELGHAPQQGGTPD